jgi:hypothetical protein
MEINLSQLFQGEDMKVADEDIGYRHEVLRESSGTRFIFLWREELP